MRLLALLLLLVSPFADDHTGSSAVTLGGDGAPPSFEGTAYFIPGMEGMGVMALATASLDGSSWAHNDEPFSYVEVVAFDALAEGTVEVGGGARVTVYHWDTHDGGPAFFAMAESGTLTLTGVADDAVSGSFSATLTQYDDAGNENVVTIEATFSAVPGNVPSP
ncbi:MAG: hypothetical protein AAF624_15490 [Bacteroidota bacterium]